MAFVTPTYLRISCHAVWPCQRPLNITGFYAQGDPIVSNHWFVLVYIDDILIYSRSLAEYRRHVA